MKSILSLIVLTLLLFSMNGAYALDSNLTTSNQTTNTPAVTNIEDTNYSDNTSYSVISFQADEKIIAGNNYNITLNINTSKGGQLNISLQRNEYKLTFLNKTEVDTGNKLYTINLEVPTYIDAGLYELTAELNGVKETKYIFVDRKLVNIFKDKINTIINATTLIELVKDLLIVLVSIFIILFLIYQIIKYLGGLSKTFFVTILVGGVLINALFIFLGIEKIPVLNLPTYVLEYSFLGALGYVFISWFKTGAEILGDVDDAERVTDESKLTKLFQKIANKPAIKPENLQNAKQLGFKDTKNVKDREDTYMKWGSRLIAAPIIGIIIYFGANSIFNINVVGDNAIKALCMVSGLFIKPVLLKSKETIFSILTPKEKLKEDLLELGKTDLVDLLGPKIALDLYDKYGYKELKEFSILTDDKIKKIAKDIDAEEKLMLDKWTISKLWIQIKACGCKVSIEELEKLYVLNIKTLSDLKSKIDKLDAFGIAKDNIECWRKYIS